MDYNLQQGEEVTLTVFAHQRFSEHCIVVKLGAHYDISCPPGQTWWDLVIPAGPAGYANPLAALFGIRVCGARCFTLCGVYGHQRGGFGIGRGKLITAASNANLYFFANDVWGFEWNNHGSIQVTVKRVG